MSDTVKMVPTGELVNGQEFVIVEPGSEAETHWRGQGYVPESELEAAAKEEESANEAEPKRGPGRPKKGQE